MFGCDMMCFVLPEKLSIRCFNNFPVLVPAFQVLKIFVQHFPVAQGGPPTIVIDRLITPIHGGKSMGNWSINYHPYLYPYRLPLTPRHLFERYDFLDPQTTYGGFLKLWYPTTVGFPTKNDHFGVFWGYHHLWKHPKHTIQTHPNASVFGMTA